MTLEPESLAFLDLLDEPWCVVDPIDEALEVANAAARRLGLVPGTRLEDAFEDGVALAEAAVVLARGPSGASSARATLLRSPADGEIGIDWRGRLQARLVRSPGGGILLQLRTLSPDPASGALGRQLRHSLEILDRLAQRLPGEAVPTDRMAVWLAAAVRLEDCVVVERLGDGGWTLRGAASGSVGEAACEEALREDPRMRGLVLAERLAGLHPTARAGRFVRIGRLPQGIRGAVMLSAGGEDDFATGDGDRVLRIAARLLETRGAVEAERGTRALSVVVAGDAGTRAVLRAALEVRGHPVVDASDAGTARTLLATDPSVGLLVIARERSVALALAEEALELRPQVGLVWCSVSGEHRGAVRSGGLAERLAVLEMPFLPDELDAALERAERGSSRD